MKKQPDKGKITALYERLSHDDERAGESVSIENQKRILEDYAQKNGFTNIRHFTDDGVRGTTFKRPGLDAMLEEIRAGNVATVIIKDQSRIGRDVVEVGLLKRTFDEYHVRFIAANDNLDTANGFDIWEPYIPFGKVTIVQGNPGEGKTTFALRLAAACTTGGTLPGMKPLPPFQVIYQTAEDGLGDTVKPRLIEAEADLDRVLVIDEAKRELTLSDERIEKAITQNGARLIILDPIQAYMGEKTDMNRANEVRPMFRRLADVAERTGCAVILIGHLNKAAGGQSAYRGLGSIDFRAAARSVLLIGRVKREPNVRVIVHDKSSLAPEGKPVAFCLDPETGFEWIGEYDITADELLSGAGGNTATKTEQAERLILDLLADGKELASEDIVKAAAEAGISERTVQNAKRNMGGILGARRVGGQWYNFIKKKQPPEPAS